MRSKKIKKSGCHIKVRRLRNGEMRAAHGGRADADAMAYATKYACGSEPGDDCTDLVIHLQANDEPSGVLLSVYKGAAQ